MRVLIDEDVASRELISRLQQTFGAGVLEPDFGATDDEVWDRAQAEGASILTANVVDFLRIANSRSDHHGLLLVYRTNDRTTDLRPGDIANAVITIDHQFAAGVANLILAVNDFRALDGV